MLTAVSFSQCHLTDVTLRNKYFRANNAWLGTDAWVKGRWRVPACCHHPAPGKAQQVQKEKGCLWHGESCPAAPKAMGQMQKQSTEVLEIASFLCRELWLPVPRASPGTRDHGSAMGGKASASPSPPRSGVAFKERAHTPALAPRVVDLCSTAVLLPPSPAPSLGTWLGSPAPSPALPCSPGWARRDGASSAPCQPGRHPQPPAHLAWQGSPLPPPLTSAVMKSKVIKKNYRPVGESLSDRKSVV